MRTSSSAAVSGPAPIWQNCYHQVERGAEAITGMVAVFRAGFREFARLRKHENIGFLPTKVRNAT